MKKLIFFKIFKSFLVLVLAVVSITYFVSLLQIENKLGPEVKQASVSVGVRVSVGRIRFKVYPEKRIPQAGNWDTIANVQVRNTGSTVPFINRNDLPTTPNGEGEITLLPTEAIDSGTYDFSIKGISHLRKNYYSYTISNLEPYFDFSATGQHLLAGDTSVIVDNYINSLDLSTMIINLYGGDYRNDLNQDGKVNSLDFGNQVYNLFKAGDV